MFQSVSYFMSGSFPSYTPKLRQSRQLFVSWLIGVWESFENSSLFSSWSLGVQSCREKPIFKSVKKFWGIFDWFKTKTIAFSVTYNTSLYRTECFCTRSFTACKVYQHFCPVNSKPVLLSPSSRLSFYVLGHVMQATHGAQKRPGESCAKLKTRPLSSFLLPLRGERTGLERRENWPRKIGRSEK